MAERAAAEHCHIAPAARRDAGYRDHDRRDARTLEFIRLPRDLGFGFEEIGQSLALWQDRSRSSTHVKALAPAHAAELKRKARELDAMRRTLERLAAGCNGEARPDCPIIDDLEAAEQDLPTLEEPRPKHAC